MSAETADVSRARQTSLCISEAVNQKLVSTLTTYPGKFTVAGQTSRGDGIMRQTIRDTDHNLEGTDFGKWVLDGDPEFRNIKSMSCYEIVLYAAVENGLIDKKDLDPLYKDQSICAKMDEALPIKKYDLNPLEAPPPEIKPGAIVIFGDTTREVESEQSPSTNVHTAVVSHIDDDGTIHVISHQGGEEVSPITTTLQAQTERTHLKGQKTQAFMPDWNKLKGS